MAMHAERQRYKGAGERRLESDSAQSRSKAAHESSSWSARNSGCSVHHLGGCPCRGPARGFARLYHLAVLRHHFFEDTNVVIEAQVLRGLRRAGGEATLTRVARAFGPLQVGAPR